MAKSIVILGILLCHIVCTGNDVQRPCVVECAIENIGESETHGANRSPFIDYCNKLVKVKEGSPWCASVVSFWHWICGIKNPMSAYSPNWFQDKDCHYIKNVKDSDRIRPGDCGGIYFPSKKRIAHIFLVESVDGKYVNTIEGNTNDEGSREGTKCMRRKRLKSSVERFSRFSK